MSSLNCIALPAFPIGAQYGVRVYSTSIGWILQTTFLVSIRALIKKDHNESNDNYDKYNKNDHNYIGAPNEIT